MNMLYGVYILCNGYTDWKQIPIELSWALGVGFGSHFIPFTPVSHFLLVFQAVGRLKGRTLACVIRIYVNPPPRRHFMIAREYVL